MPLLRPAKGKRIKAQTNMSRHATTTYPGGGAADAGASASADGAAAAAAATTTPTTPQIRGSVQQRNGRALQKRVV